MTPALSINCYHFFGGQACDQKECAVKLPKQSIDSCMDFEDNETDQRTYGTELLHDYSPYTDQKFWWNMDIIGTSTTMP
ncbi:hypothetical protein EUGRSUZ_A00977 [Eucalyptus grandis]|uniref:Uncharacterized protein n=2 Tax=Eucalyptus grandis TaxID=71139 RepID=A0ACC3M4Q1_EUCGR|nr:hypothetical protein EUGRSUZ_A00977 [Eucalyptus grandis]